MFRTIMSSVRSDLRLIYDNSVNAVKPNSLIKNFIEIKENQILIKNISKKVEKSFSLQNSDLYIFGAGKAVLNMCEEFLNQFDVFVSSSSINQMPVIRKGLLSVPIGSNTTSKLFAKYGVTYKCGALHNMPDLDSLKTTQEIVDLIKNLKTSSETKPLERNPLIICFISGGGSALLSLPKPGITLQQKCSLISRLVKSGATIDQLNTVRQCLSEVKSGKLAKLSISGRNSIPMISLIISDIIDDPIHLIASGPTVISTKESLKSSENAIKILKSLNIEVTNDIKNVILSEDEESVSCDTKLLENIIIGNNSIALKEAQNTAQSLGYKSIFLGNSMRGEASHITKDITQNAIEYKPTEEELKNFKGICWVGGGETTVNMIDSKIGLGGRCQEMCLTFYRIMGRDCKQKLYLLCAGTDGQDGPTDVAGVIAESVSQSDQIWNESDIYLKDHNSYHFFKRYYNHWFVKTGITGTNVMDIYCLIKSFEKN